MPLARKSRQRARRLFAPRPPPALTAVRADFVHVCGGGPAMQFVGRLVRMVLFVTRGLTAEAQAT